jgi:VIT1/CCC1 family predicted Fe2+/Mn2+ transporter
MTMSQPPSPVSPPSAAVSDAADHDAEARHRARQVLAGESHLGAVDDWRRALISARDALILVWLAWIALHGFGDPPFTGWMLVALAIALAALIGISTARSTHTQVEFYASELERERHEIRTDFEHEREEVRALYAAKGFQEPLLSQVVETLCADDDRLLKVMMEEELGLSLFHVNHPLVVGLWNFAGAAVAGLALALPAALAPSRTAHWWMPLGGASLMFVVACLSARYTGRPLMEFFAVGLIMALVTGGVAFALSRWFAQSMGIA